MKSGIAPELVRSQVKNTASWLWEDPRARAAAIALDALDAAERDRTAPDGSNAYLRLLLSAHWSTVATFVPTDVDARIRHHAWAAMETEEEIARACDVVDEVAAWDVRAVSARVVESDHGTMCGHDGEWLGVRAGALGRAIAVGAKATIERLVDALDRELEREARIFDDARATKPGAERTQRILSSATVIAHNLGDLSRVVDQWPVKDAAVQSRYLRLGHPDAQQPRASFVLAGRINKEMTALENHRFLALRKPRGLRSARSLLLPIGPWFDAWGETIARENAIDEKDRAEIAGALVEIHLSSPDQQGCLRALAGMHRATRGGLELYVPDMPARIRKEALRGKVREAIDTTEERFRARMDARLARCLA